MQQIENPKIDMNIILRIKEKSYIYYRIDSIVSEDNNDKLNYPLMFLHKLKLMACHFISSF